ncbi:hypothetical protein Pla22_28950 [Rubripirellula amarantea]|uniref:Uncharacterized protein n=1 Tax=Rubripirellula amarantea TaxID=2527999 RepID=A0A5C5WJ70_9BACT|nr:hypothetical protein Pla22_28950 [Rubripirellula amarantea]
MEDIALIINRDRHRFGVAVSSGIGDLHTDVVRGCDFVVQNCACGDSNLTGARSDCKSTIGVVGQAEREVG